MPKGTGHTYVLLYICVDMNVVVIVLCIFIYIYIYIYVCMSRPQTNGKALICMSTPSRVNAWGLESGGLTHIITIYI